MTITTISIEGLWGKYSLRWNLNPDVSVLSGINGSGKSTVLHAIAGLISGRGLPKRYLNRLRNLTVEMSDGSRISLNDDSISTSINFEFISTFDNAPLKDEFTKPGKYMEYLMHTNGISELDLMLDNMIERFRSYQIELSTRMSKMVASGKANPETVRNLFGAKDMFYDVLDDFFSETRKHLNRDKGEVEFIFEDDGKSHPYSDLSAGEKQLLLIMLSVFMQGGKDTVLIMDEPEISMHIDWQNRLIAEIRKLNPNCQVIVSTHSPAMILDGWQNSVANMADIISEEV